LQIIHGDKLAALKSFADDSLDALVTDPPGGIAFMGKDWDKDKGGRSAWVAWMTNVMRECLRVLKPGAHGMVWALPRTSHGPPPREDEPPEHPMNPKTLNQWIDELRLMLDDDLITCKQAALDVVNYELDRLEAALLREAFAAQEVRH
jgi:DNA modification methylase